MSDPTNPVKIGNYNTTEGTWRVVVSGGYAYISNIGNGLVILGIGEAVSPSISDINFSPSFVIQSDLVRVEAVVTDSSGVSSVHAVYRVNNGPWVSYVMTLQDTALSLYSALLGPFNTDDFVEFYVEAFDAGLLENHGVNDNSGAYYSFLVYATDNTNPVISDVVANPSTPLDNETVVISGNITDPRGILNASLFYRVDGGAWTVVAMALRQGTTSV